MDENQKDEVLKSLIAFVNRVSKDTEASPAELVALPRVASVLFDVTILKYHIDSKKEQANQKQKGGKRYL